jgi:hypothetical protein
LHSRRQVNPKWIRLKATADTTSFPAGFLEQERRALGKHSFQREYLGIPGGGHASPFGWELCQRATNVHEPRIPGGADFGPPAAPKPIPKSQSSRESAMIFRREDPNTWPSFRPLIIAHDVGRIRDRSTAVIGHLDKALDEAQAKGWTVVDMKNDWKTIFPFGSK